MEMVWISTKLSDDTATYNQNPSDMNTSQTTWPTLDFLALQDTLETLHQWIQIVGKIKLKTMPWQNHSWHTALYVTASGFSTHSIPYQGTTFQIDFDFKKHKLLVQCAHTEPLAIVLESKTVAQFYEEVFDVLAKIGVSVKIYAKPNEIEPAIPFAENTVNKTYVPEYADAIWRSMLRANEVFSHFRASFIGKASPVHLFWGSFDLAVTRFSGETAPLYEGKLPNMSMEVMQEAYSEEVSSAGFWLGSKDFPTPVFYAYAYPSGSKFGEQKVLPEQAFYSEEMGEFFLKYEDVIQSGNPEEVLYSFLQSTYDAAVRTSDWDTDGLERQVRD